MVFNDRFKLAFGFLILVYISSPVIFKYSTLIQRSLLFMNHVNTQYGFNLSHPEQLGLKCARTLRLDNNLDPEGQKVELGVWHILPESSLTSCHTIHQSNRTTIEDTAAFTDSRPIILYVHGNGGTRGGDHRSQLYRRLAYEHDYHVITFDYRGYGDSTYLTPTSHGLSSDALFMYNWLLSQPNVDRQRITVWGHSLGTAVAVSMVSSLPHGSKPRNLILEAPFDSISNAIANHPFSVPFRVIPYFDYFFTEPIENTPELNFDSAKLIGNIKPTPLMILHAEDDAIIPLKLGQKLYATAHEKLGKSQVKLITIGAHEGLGHKHICQHDKTMSEVRRFIES